MIEKADSCKVQRCHAVACKHNKKKQCTLIFVSVDNEGKCQQFLEDDSKLFGKPPKVQTGKFNFRTKTDKEV